MKKNEIMTIEEVAKYFRLELKSVYRLVKANKIPAFKVGGSWRFDRYRLTEWIEEQQDRVEE